VTDRPTDHATRSVRIGRIYVRSTAMRPNNLALTKVRTDSSTEFGSCPILIARIQIKSAAGSNLILIVQIRTALDTAVDFNERVTAFVQCFTLSFANGRIFSDGPWEVTVGIRSVLDR